MHNLSTHALDRKMDKLLIFLNDANVKYPGTNLTLRYTRIGFIQEMPNNFKEG
jgi:hypothetical protein